MPKNAKNFFKHLHTPGKMFEPGILVQSFGIQITTATTWTGFVESAREALLQQCRAPGNIDADDRRTRTRRFLQCVTVTV